MLQASTIVIVGFVTAVLLFTAVLLLTWGKVAGQTDWLEATFASLMGTVIVTGWVSTVLVTFGWFSLTGAAAALLVGGAGVFLWQRPLPLPRFAPLKWPEWLLLILLLGSAIVYFRPHEYVLGGIDPGVYVNMAATAVRTGDFILTDEWSSFLREYPEATLREQPPQWRTRYLQFVGWYIDDQDAARLIPQFFPFHPILIAVGIGLAGLYGGLLVTPLWGTLGLAAIFLLARQIFNNKVGLLAATLYAITPIHIYFARYPATEPLTLLLIFTGLLSFQKIWDNQQGQKAWGILGGASFGVSFLTRIDLPLVALLIGGWLILVWWQRRWTPGWRSFALTLAVLAAHAGLSAFLLNAPYMWNTYGSLLSVIRGQWAVQLALAGAVILLTGGMWLMWRYSWTEFRQTKLANFINGRLFRRFLAMGVVLLSAFAYFLRPLLQPASSYLTWPAGTTAWVLDGENWVRMGWYLTPLGLILATLGLAWLLQRVSFTRTGLFLTVGIFTTLQYVYKIFNTPYHIYTMRRYVPVVLPMLMIYTAVCLIYLWQTKPRLASVAAGILTLGLMSGLVYQSRFVLPLREYRGAIAQVEGVASSLAPEAIVVFNEPASATFSDTFGPPLKFIYGHEIVTLRDDDPSFLTWLQTTAQEKGRPLQLITTEPISPLLLDYFSPEPVAFVPGQLPLLMNSFTQFPTVTTNAYYGVEIYTLLPRAAQLNHDSLFIDLGSLDSVYIVDGFYAKEPLPGPITLRWTTDKATLRLPGEEATRYQIEVQAKTIQLAGVPEQTVTVWLDDIEVAQFTPTTDWVTYSFMIDAGRETAVPELSFHVNTFNPAQLQINSDTRNLGFMLDWVQLTPLPVDGQE